jgi:hypothetical protein
MTEQSSGADSAYPRFCAFLAGGNIFLRNAPKLSEADTRAKLIDPLFRDILGWTEVEIRREKPTADGYADYILGADFNYLLVEAKRTKPRFKLNIPSKARKLQLSGPHLLGQRSVRPVLEQARSYATDLGAQFALVTNGDQFILFKPHLPGKPWHSGVALVWHDHQDIRDDFAAFFSFLARDSVVSGQLAEAFESAEGVAVELFTPLDMVQNSDRELVRNRFWPKISSVLGPILSDRPEYSAAQEEVIEHCYVTTPLSDEADRNLDRLIRDTPPVSLSDAGVVDVHPGTREPFSHRFRDDVQRSRPGTYILTGGVGSGKTTFLLRFANIAQPGFVKTYCVWLHIDFLSIGNVEPAQLDVEIKAFTFRAIRSKLDSDYPQYCPTSAADVASLFANATAQAKITRLYGLVEGSIEWNSRMGELLESLYKDHEAYSLAILRRLRGRGLRAVIVLDNTDQLGEAFQERVFLLAQRLSGEYGALTIVALREEKFFAAYRRGIFDAYGDRRFHIGFPDLHRVVYRRLDYGRRRFAELAKGGSLSISEAEAESIDKLLQSLIHSTTVRNSNIIRMLACVSNGDMRHALDMFREFISSGNTNVEKILAIGPGYSVPFHEFAKSAILGSRRYYRSSVSSILNLFARSEARAGSHLTACRVLARLAMAQGVASTHGEGFVSTQKLLREYRESFGVADDFVTWSGELLRRGLIESEPPRQSDILKTDALRIIASGAYYWQYLVRSFAYLDLVYIDTPLSDEKAARNLAQHSESTEITTRIERVRLFLGILGKNEEAELREVSKRSGPYVNSLVQGIEAQVEREIRVIKRKLSRRQP